MLFKVMILHLFEGSSFIKETQYVLKDYKDQNKYVVLTNNSGIINKQENVLYLNEKKVINYIKTYNPKTIVIHYLTAAKISVIIKSNYQGRVHWSAWGGDYYLPYLGFIYSELFGKNTFLFLRKYKLLKTVNIMTRTQNWLRPIFLFIYKITKGKPHDYSIVVKFLNRIDSCSLVLPIEFNKIQEMNYKIDYIPFVYGDLDLLIPKALKLDNNFILGHNVIVGNSGSSTNNHPDVYKKLDKQFSIVSPVSYGELNYIKNLKQEYIDHPIKFIDNHLSLNDYVDFLKSCNTMVINAFRQQAVGNIIIGIYLGMRVYLNKKNPTYNFLKSLKVNVFCFDTEFDIYKNKQLNTKEILENRANIRKYWGKSNVNKIVSKFIRES